MSATPRRDQHGPRRQNGRYSKLTQRQIDAVRVAYAMWYQARRTRFTLADEYGISLEVFNRVGRGLDGAKPRPEPTP